MDAQTIAQWLVQHGAVLIFGLLVLGVVGLPIPDETILAVAGYLVSEGTLRAGPVFFAGLFGAMCGITLSYGIGHYLGHWLLRHPKRWLPVKKERLDRVHDWFEHNGKWSLVFGYFIPGVRHLVAIVAGSSSMTAAHFAVFAYSGAILWVTTFLSLGYGFGAQWSRLSARIHHMTLLAIAVAALVAGIGYLVKRGVERRRTGRG